MQLSRTAVTFCSWQNLGAMNHISLGQRIYMGQDQLNVPQVISHFIQTGVDLCIPSRGM